MNNTKQIYTIPVEAIKKVVIWLWKNSSWIIPVAKGVYNGIKNLIKKKPK
jgi:hypothetical protein